MASPAPDHELIATIRDTLRAAADPARAPTMQAYMKSAMPYLGVTVPAMRAIVRAAARVRPPTSTTGLAATAGELWRTAQFREERYAAAALTDVPAARNLQTPELLPLYEEMITTGAWWDHVDEVAHRVCRLLLEHPDAVRPTVIGWATSPDRWLRRSAVIAQLGAKERTDVALLTDAILANAADRDFFLRKAIGWALREYARTDPEWVRAFVHSHAGELSPLSRREALTRIGP